MTESQDTSPRHGELTWISQTAARPFDLTQYYGALLGWRETFLDDPGSYLMSLKESGHPVALITAPFELPVGPIKGWLPQFWVQDATQTKDDVESNGGSIVFGTADAEGHLLFVAKDPAGNTFAFTNSDKGVRPDEQGQGLSGARGWLDMAVEDADTIREFYQSIFGWETTRVSMGDYDDFAMSVAGKDQPEAGICFRKGFNADHPTGWTVYFTVPSVKEALAKNLRLGGTVVKSSVSDEGSFAVMTDPNGSQFAVWEAQKNGDS